MSPLWTYAYRSKMYLNQVIETCSHLRRLIACANYVQLRFTRFAHSMSFLSGLFMHSTHYARTKASQTWGLVTSSGIASNHWRSTYPARTHNSTATRLIPTKSAKHLARKPKAELALS